ncbi:DUF3122 domain-containing protein [Allocoleopsis franciscana]|uniref:DUF3122 domain-containing protein n=1 Tax=Allocoleopsis franciscana PCC 7113 TaxID=1173027 RepID=K9WID6_9CYAN|nr:DUF3122 domain-containing protein [Allocoleopsis franciscana]AFZ20160.1 Protein of unknown function (DUF3122) [Allocoleopsis franciscana PCC 7113]
MIHPFHRSIVSCLLLLSLLLLMSFGSFNPKTATAAVLETEEAPGQMLYQSRQTLRDQTGNRWQAIAFKRIKPDGTISLNLRLVGFPGVVELDHTQPLILTTSLGQRLTAKNISRNVLTDTLSATNIGQYDVMPVLSQLKAEIPLQLTLITTSGSVVKLLVPPNAIQEWQTLATLEV